MYFKIKKKWGLGIGDWGLGIGDWAHLLALSEYLPEVRHVQRYSVKQQWIILKEI